MLKTYDQFITQVGLNNTLNQPMWDERQVATTASLFGGGGTSWQRNGYMKSLPTPLPTGITAYIPTRVIAGLSATNSRLVLLGKLINLGSFALDSDNGTFTDGVAMPTVTELGVSRVMASALMVEVTTALSATPGSLAITYVDQDGNAAEAVSAKSMAASVLTQSAFIYQLTANDWGVRDITAAVRSVTTTTGGVLQFWGIVPISLFFPTVLHPYVDNLMTGNFHILRLGAGDTIGCFVSGSNFSGVWGDVYFVGDS